MRHDNLIPEEEENDKQEQKRLPVVIKKRVISVDLPALAKNRLNERRMGRILACQGLYFYEMQPGLSSDQICRFEWSKKKSRRGVLPFAEKLIRGTIEILDQIDDLIKPKLIDWEFSRVSPINKSILRLSIYSLLYMTDIPPAVVIDEAVDLAKMFSEKEDYKFINAVLDKIAADKNIKFAPK